MKIGSKLIAVGHLLENQEQEFAELKGLGMAIGDYASELIQIASQLMDKSYR